MTRDIPASAEAGSVDVCICTFRRPQIEATLASLSRSDAAPMRVIVADNDDGPEAAERIMQAAARLGLSLTYVHAPARNISVARNACLTSATADWIAFVDDDEVVSPAWLSALLDEAQRGGWDVVLGPVAAIYDDQAPAWMRAGDFHSTRPAWVRGRILTGYTCNVLIRRSLVERLGLRFDPTLGLSGGEDNQFFYRLSDAGARIGFAPEALVYEPVPAPRARLSWLLQRHFRAGQTHGSRLIARGLLRRPLEILVATAKAGVCAVGAAVTFWRTDRRNRFILRGALHAGVVARLSGRRELQLYKTS